VRGVLEVGSDPFRAATVKERTAYHAQVILACKALRFITVAAQLNLSARRMRLARDVSSESGYARRLPQCILIPLYQVADENVEETIQPMLQFLFRVQLHVSLGGCLV